MTKLNLQINPDLDVISLAKRFAATGRLQIPNFLTPASAENLMRALTDNKVWYYTYSDASGHFETPEAEINNASADMKILFWNRISQFARENFQYIYRQYTISMAVDNNEDTGHELHEFYDFVRSEVFLDFMKKLIGDDDVVRADAVATSFSGGQFLSKHDDHHDRHDRRAAYVLNMTPTWRPDWGAYLMFYDQDGNIVEGYVPTFNGLNVFRTPQPHCVSYVPPFAGANRYAISGWLRAT